MVAEEFITAGEFTRWRGEEKEFRETVRGQLGQILALQSDQNVRVSKTETEVAVIRRELEAIKSEDAAIERVVVDIQQHGCHQYEKHAAAMAALTDAGVVSLANGPRPITFSMASLTRMQKAVAGVGLATLLIPAVGDLLQLLTALVQYVRP